VIKEPAPSLRTTEIIVQKGDFQAAKTLQNSWGIGRVESSSTGDLPSDLTIRLGSDVQFLLDTHQ
jgi:hypothetical protein